MADGPSDLVVVVMAGGAGTRFWPLSTPELPKQFMQAFGETSFFQQAIARAEALVPAERILVLTHRTFLGLARTQAPQLAADQFVGEPMRRDTAPAVALAATLVERRWPGSISLVLPADHVIRETPAFVASTQTAVDRAREGGLGTFGIRPSYPATGYGYLHLSPDKGEAVGNREGGKLQPRPRAVEEFVEKPDRKTAEEFLRRSDYFWNSGMFVWKTQAIAEAVKTHLPEVHARVSPLGASFGSPNFEEELRETFESLTPLSIDYGVMERESEVWAVEATFDWSDVGGWLAALDLLESDGSENRIRGPVVTEGVRESLVLADDPERPVICVGVEGLIVASTGEGTLICNRDSAEKIKPHVQSVLESETRSTDRDRRPWGHYEILSDTDDHKVKRIVVDPGQRLSLQRHRFRSEHWHVVSGEALVTRDEEEIPVRPGESIDLPQGCWHRVRNPKDEPLVFIEVQRGTYFGEDDIERRSDDYGRTAPTP